MLEKYKVYSTKEIEEIMADVDPLIYIKDNTIYEKEKFKQIDIDGLYIPYIVSSYGRIFSIHYNHIDNNLHQLATTYSKHGYEKIAIRYDFINHYLLVHRLVAKAFIYNDDPDHKDAVNHINGIKSDNHVWNLEWCTDSENRIHALKTGLAKGLSGEENGASKCKEKQAHKICKLLEANKSINEIYEITGVSKNIIWNILHHISWTHVSNNYDFSNYLFGKKQKEIEERDNKIHEICRLLEENKLTLPDICHITNTSYNYVQDILYKKVHTNISSLYDIDNFDKYIKNHK